MKSFQGRLNPFKPSKIKKKLKEMTDVIFFLSFFRPVFLIYGDKINCSIKWDDESVELAIRKVEIGRGK